MTLNFLRKVSDAFSNEIIHWRPICRCPQHYVSYPRELLDFLGERAGIRKRRGASRRWQPTAPKKVTPAQADDPTSGGEPQPPHETAFQTEFLAQMLERGNLAAREIVALLMAGLEAKRRDLRDDQRRALLRDPLYLRALYPFMCAAFPEALRQGFDIIFKEILDVDLATTLAIEEDAKLGKFDHLNPPTDGGDEWPEVIDEAGA
jgi:hypothetical protein